MLVDRYGEVFQKFEEKEMDTGLKWYDGRSIYRKYVRIDLSNYALSREVNISANDYDYVFIEQHSCLWSAKSYDLGADHYFYPVNFGKDVNALIHNNNLVVSLASSFSGWYNVFYISLLYIKKH